MGHMLSPERNQMESLTKMSQSSREKSFSPPGHLEGGKLPGRTHRLMIIQNCLPTERAGKLLTYINKNPIAFMGIYVYVNIYEKISR